MKLDEAIESLETEADLLQKKGFLPRASAQKLGIEAIERFKDFRLRGRLFNTDFLPSETKE